MEKASASTPKNFLGLAAGSLGVVYGDIGTSPLYALRECFVGVSGFPVTSENVLGILSLILWSLLFIISVKYLLLILRADNQGEGGILALVHLIVPKSIEDWTVKDWTLLGIGLFGAALLYGDGIITPSLSVLSAVEGLNVATPIFKSYTVPITIGILTGLFALQYRGTKMLSHLFGPITFLWFLVLAGLGFQQIWLDPSVLSAINPIHAVRFFDDHGFHGTLVLGAVFLVVTGGEALYADLGHFGRGPIQFSWFTIVLPSLLLNYLGQGALLLRSPEKIENIFYYLAPEWAIYPLVGLATLATIVASQAVISGVFSLTSQAIQLNYLPRSTIRHTSAATYGQIYVPAANWLLFVGTLALVLGFRSSGSLANAYGIAVSLTMVITSILLYFVFLRVWKWKPISAVAVTTLLLVINLIFFSSIMQKVTHGGWIPLSIAGLLFSIMLIWRKGQHLVQKKIASQENFLRSFVREFETYPVSTNSETNVYLVRDLTNTPRALLEDLDSRQERDRYTFLLHVNQCQQPYMHQDSHAKSKKIGDALYLIDACFGFMERPDIFLVMNQVLAKERLKIDPKKVTYILTKEEIIATKGPGLPLWAKKAYSYFSQRSVRVTDFFNIEPSRLLEIKTEVEI